MRQKNLNLVSYFGGKWPHLDWLKSHLPVGNYHFIDAMCGAANVALNVNYPLVTINDLNDEIVNLFQVLRENEEDFIRAIYFTPFSISELYRCIEEPVPFDNPVERARRYFVKCQIGYGANGSQNNHKGAGMEFVLQKSNYYRVDNWNNKLDKLPAIIEKLRRFQVFKKDVFWIIDRFDKPNNVIYIDPPYVLSSRKSKKRYVHEWSDSMHIELCSKISTLKHAKVCLSGYENEIYTKLLSNLYLTKDTPKKASVSKSEAQEVIWTNYVPNTTLNLFTSQTSTNECG